MVLCVYEFPQNNLFRTAANRVAPPYQLHLISRLQRLRNTFLGHHVLFHNLQLFPAGGVDFLLMRHKPLCNQKLMI